MAELSCVQTEFLHIVRAHLRGESYSLPQDFSSPAELVHLAAEHKLAPIVYDTIHNDPVLQAYPDLLREWKRGVLRDTMLQMQREIGFLQLYERLTENGIRPLVMKGMICRYLYPKPDYRASADEDILVHEEEMELCDRLLLEMGFQRSEEEVARKEQEISYINPNSGVYIELHRALFPEENKYYGFLERVFHDPFQQSITENLQNKEICTLHPTKHILFLICHSMKHFSNGGFGIRQLCDMVMMAEHYGKAIDWEEIHTALVSLRLEQFFSALLSIAQDYLGFSAEKSGIPAKMLDDSVPSLPLILDMLGSGIYGSAADRTQANNMVHSALEQRRKNTAASVFSSLFPPKDYIMRKYLWVKKVPILLPLGYIVRIVSYLFHAIFRRDGKSNALKLGMERIEILRLYHIID